MSKLTWVDLNHQVPDVDGVSFLRAEWWDERSHFVLVRFALNGEEQELGLRLDLDKRVFLDHLSDPKTDKLIQDQVRPIWAKVVSSRHTLP
jgi:hypothetical protein